MAGRRPVSAARKALQGNPGKRPPKGPPKVALTEAPTECPAWLAGEARAEWARVVAEAVRLGVLTLIGAAALEAYCVAYQRWRQAEAAVAVLIEAGTLNVAIGTGLEGMARDRMRLMLKAATDCCITPATIGKLAPPVKGVDPFEDFDGLKVVDGGKR